MTARRTFVVHAGLDVGAALARGLAARGADVTLFDAEGLSTAPDPGIERVACSLGTRATLELAFGSAAERLLERGARVQRAGHASDARARCGDQPVGIEEGHVSAAGGEASCQRGTHVEAGMNHERAPGRHADAPSPP